MREPGHLDWVRRQRDLVPLMTSVCTGSLVYAAAGLLTGRRATTHWASLNLLSETDPTVITDVNARYVDDGDLVTSAGVSAGIDMALHLVTRFAGAERARAVQREIQYEPTTTL
jgi:transcriptional regulator GlxA family with amidase domain